MVMFAVSDGCAVEGSLLSRYLVNLPVSRSLRSRDDSLNSSDSEYSTGTGEGEERGPGSGRQRNHNKVNLRQLEERLNMIQEECNRCSAEQSSEEVKTSDIFLQVVRGE